MFQKKLQLEKIILIDIDSTLYDNLYTRHKALKPVLKRLLLDNSISQLLKNYERIVDIGDVFDKIGLVNFKHIWSSKELYAVLTVLFTRNPDHLCSMGISESDQAFFLKALEETHRSLMKMHRIYPNTFQIKRNTFQPAIKNIALLRFITIVNKIKNHKLFRNADKAFKRNLVFKPNKGVVEFLYRMYKAGFQMNVVTEGYHDIQCNKINKLGLAHLFRNRILTSEDATTPFGIKTLYRQIVLIENKIAIKTASPEDKKELNALKSIIKMLKEYENKSNPLFFGRIIHAIVSDPGNPYKALKKFAVVSSDEWVKKNNIKIVMIGDRYDKDVRPLINLLGKKNVMTIRYQKGKHRKSFLPHSVAPSQQPDLTAHSFRTIQKFLLTDKVWNEKNLIKTPPRFMNLPPNTISYFRYIKVSSKPSIIKKFGQILKQETVIQKVREKRN